MISREKVIRMLEDIAVWLELAGENPFKSRAYSNAARSLEKTDADLTRLVQTGAIYKIDGIGEAIGKKLTELVETGRLEYYEKLKASIPPGHLDLLKIGGLGPRKISALHRTLGITTVGELEYACLENRLLDLLGLCTVKKEMVLMVTEQKIAFEVLEILNSKYNFDGANGAIAFCIPVAHVYGARCYENVLQENEEGGAVKTMYRAIFTIVDRGRAEDVIDAANEAGAKGGTIINARGSGIHETNKLFSMEIEPEKEMVMILSEKNTVESIVSSIRNKLDIDEAGKGIIFVQEVSKAYGLR